MRNTSFIQFCINLYTNEDFFPISHFFVDCSPDLSRIPSDITKFIIKRFLGKQFFLHIALTNLAQRAITLEMENDFWLKNYWPMRIFIEESIFDKLGSFFSDIQYQCELAEKHKAKAEFSEIALQICKAQTKLLDEKKKKAEQFPADPNAQNLIKLCNDGKTLVSLFFNAPEKRIHVGDNATHNRLNF